MTERNLTVHVPADDDVLFVTQAVPVAELHNFRGTSSGRVFVRYGEAMVWALAENLNEHAFGTNDILHLEFRVTRERRL
jgi:hypothetical protein